MAPLDFQDYVLIWWEQVIERREARGEPPITTWAQMKDVMRAHFVLTYYNCALFKKIQLLKQGTKSVEEYYQEMEIAMIRANVKEDDELTMERFLNGLNHPIKRIDDFQPYSNLLDLVHQATKAERQVQDDFKYAKYSSKTYDSYSQAPATSAPPTSTRASQVLATSQVPSKWHLPRLVLRQAPTNPRLLHLRCLPMIPLRQVQSSASHAVAEVTSTSNAPTSKQ